MKNKKLIISIISLVSIPIIWYISASQRGAIQAMIDHKNKTYILYSWGYAPNREAILKTSEILKDRYNIKLIQNSNSNIKYSNIKYQIQIFKYSNI